MSTSYPIPTYNYRVRIAGLSISFSEVSGLAVQHEEVVYRHGLSTTKGYLIQRGFAKPINISLKKGIIVSDNQDEKSVNNYLYDAFVRNNKFDIDIDLCDHSGTALITWKVIGAVTLKYELPGLQASANDVAIETIDLLARNLLLENKTNAV